MILIDKWLKKYSDMPEVDGTAVIIPLQAKPLPPTCPAGQNQKEVQLREQVKAIEDEALSLGWERDQLDELARTLKVYMPLCKIGNISLRAIEIVHLYNDGTVRGYSNFYNMRTDQPWLKKCAKG